MDLVRYSFTVIYNNGSKNKKKSGSGKLNYSPTKKLISWQESLEEIVKKELYSVQSIISIIIDIKDKKKYDEQQNEYYYLYTFSL